MAVKESARLEVGLVVVSAEPGTVLSFTATVRSDTDDPKPDNNSATATTTVVADRPKPPKK